MATTKTATTPSPRAPRKTATPASKQPSSAKTAPATKAPEATTKTKLIRDSFTIPKSEYLVLDSLKLRLAELKRPAKKSELLRAGIKSLEAMSDRTLLAALDGVPSLKTGRPKAVRAEHAPTKGRK